jgi:hypothetical protein
MMSHDALYKPQLVALALRDHESFPKRSRIEYEVLMANEFPTFSDFYPYYLSEHQNRTCRRLHFIGSTIGLACAVTGLLRRRPALFPLGIAIGYGCSWVGHFFFENNRPATFQHPLYSFIGDWAMWRDIVTGRIEF